MNLFTRGSRPGRTQNRSLDFLVCIGWASPSFFISVCITRKNSHSEAFLWMALRWPEARGAVLVVSAASSGLCLCGLHCWPLAFSSRCQRIEEDNGSQVGRSAAACRLHLPLPLHARRDPLGVTDASCLRYLGWRCGSLMSVPSLGVCRWISRNACDGDCRHVIFGTTQGPYVIFLSISLSRRIPIPVRWKLFSCRRATLID